MGIRIWGSFSSYDKQYKKSQPKNPNPKNFILKKCWEVGNNFVIIVNYPDCVNYEGNKILVYKNCTKDDLLRQESIDPHFSDNKNYFSPFARFEPTDEGKKLAIELAKVL